MRAVFVFTPPESKRFIAKAVAHLPEVKRAKARGEIVIGHGSTNVYVSEEILGHCPDRDKFLSGQIIHGILCVTQAEEKPPMIVIRKGQLVRPELTMEETLKNFDAGSIFIKGANAVDLERNAGVFVAHGSGGTIGYAYGILSARGCRLIVPVGLEKLVPSVQKAAKLCGQGTFQYSQGIRIGMVPMVNAKVITEMEAFQVLFGLEAVHIGGGGVSGSEGSVVLVTEGERKRVNKAIALIESIKGEPGLQPRKSLCINCRPTTPSLLAPAKDDSTRRKIKHCMYRGKKESELPCFLQE